MNVRSETFDALPEEARAGWSDVWTSSAEQLDEDVAVKRIEEDQTDSSICVFLEGPELGELRVFVSRDALAHSRYDDYLAALSIAVTQARFATGF